MNRDDHDSEEEEEEEDMGMDEDDLRENLGRRVGGGSRSTRAGGSNGTGYKKGKVIMEVLYLGEVRHLLISKLISIFD